VGKSVLTSALVYGLSAVVPPVGVIAIPLYSAYGYSKLGFGLYKVYNELISKRKISIDSAKDVYGEIGEFASQRSADEIAAKLVSNARVDGIVEEVAKNSHVNEFVLEEMLRGSTSSALSSSAGELAKFVVGKAVGA
jgi:hypothetical protein